MKYYAGERAADGTALVWVSDGGKRRPLPLRLDLDNHSPTGFEWGYGGSGPAQLALAILADALGDDIRAVRLHQKFKWRCIATLPPDQPWRFMCDWVCATASELAAQSINSHAMGKP